MDKSLSLIMPVHNAQQWLARDVERLLDVLPEMTDRFEVVIIDDGSTDHTEEAAQELSCRFPQVKLHRHARCTGIAAAVDTGSRHAEGEVVLIHDARKPVVESDLLAMWRMHQENAARPVAPAPQMPAKSGLGLDQDLLERLMKWGSDVKKERPAHSPDLMPRPNFLRKVSNFALGE
ncbi:glycosyltransferase family 2 protein [Blastopirellula marina]|uniref:Dolichol-phosphate mannosyltransferase n=1 Tax=Blastopirellula marina DSM 3645 TaxID=314230 RepID=A3ZTQ1_9BACT|nr:glycosyltransferase family 2 protein [Blastopirellula marina]EAQ79953.1 dolichol-phosphate mannosyltransferase [Blastopirellula marina DSM 3645]